jgi:hypothetical protein
MPLYRVIVEKYMPSANEYWSNVYHVVAADVGAAILAGEDYAAAERAILTPLAIITKVRVDDKTPDTDVGATSVLNLAGLRDFGGGTIMPLFVVARVDFTVLGGGRPSRKYLRGMLGELDVTFTALSPTALSELAVYAQAICTASANDVDNQIFVSGAVWPQPAMRQLRRGSKKKLVP